uniref:Uncharacterized protein n=1 Tax=Cannabis sativa TaxID=3483 RepID=A0A803PMB0_CANSA
MADDTQHNKENQPEETNHRPRKEPQASQRTNTTEIPRFGRNDGDFNRTGEQTPERQNEDAYDPTKYVLMHDARKARNQPGTGRPPRHPQRPNRNDKDSAHTFMSRGRMENLFRRRRPMREESYETGSSTNPSGSRDIGHTTEEYRQLKDEIENVILRGYLRHRMRRKAHRVTLL